MSDLHYKLLGYIERGGQVQRMHTVPTLHSQNVAAHSFGVAWWCWLLTPGQSPTANLLMAALAHDLPEGVYGDIPAPTKRTLRLNEILEDWEAVISEAAGLPVFELTENEQRILKLSDCLELVQHCVRERALGNHCTQLREMFDTVISYTEEIALTIFEKSMVNAVGREWEEF